LEIGLALSFGAFWSSPSDVSGSFRHKKFGILFSAISVMVVSFIKGYLHFDPWLFSISDKMLKLAASVKFLQIWVFPNEKNVTPRYDQISLKDIEKENEFY
jgi:hypothetical protein